MDKVAFIKELNEYVKQDVLDKSMEEMEWAIRLASYGDYDNSCAVERSNYRLLKDEFSSIREAGLLRWETGSYGGKVTYIVIPSDWNETIEAACKELLDLLSGVCEYLWINEEDVSNLEIEMESKAWNNWGFSDFVSVVIKRWELSSEMDDIFESRDCYSDWVELCEKYNGGSCSEIESGGVVYFPFDDVLEKVKDDDAFVIAKLSECSEWCIEKGYKFLMYSRMHNTVRVDEEPDYPIKINEYKMYEDDDNKLMVHCGIECADSNFDSMIDAWKTSL